MLFVLTQVFSFRYNWQHCFGAEAGCGCNGRWHQWWPCLKKGWCWVCHGMWVCLTWLQKKNIPPRILCARFSFEWFLYSVLFILRALLAQTWLKKPPISFSLTTTSAALSRPSCGGGTFMTAFQNSSSSSSLSMWWLWSWPSLELASHRYHYKKLSSNMRQNDWVATDGAVKQNSPALREGLVLTDAPWWLMEAADCYPSWVKWLEIVRLRQEDLQAACMGPGTAVHRQSTSPKWASSLLLNGVIFGLIAVEVLYYCIMNGRITFAICIAVSSQGWTWPQASGALLV